MDFLEIILISKSACENSLVPKIFGWKNIMFGQQNGRSFSPQNAAICSVLWVFFKNIFWSKCNKIGFLGAENPEQNWQAPVSVK